LRIARILDLELTALVPRQAELVEGDDAAEISDTMRKRVGIAAKGDKGKERSLRRFVGRLLKMIEVENDRRGS
jgi:hypothetical protein